MARHAGISPIARRCSTPSPKLGSSASAPNCAARWTALRRTSTRGAALLELMFAGKHGEQSGALHEAGDRAFSVMLELIEQGQAEGVLEPGEPERVGLVLFATIQGIAALVSGGMVDTQQFDELVADAIAHFLRGSRIAA